MWTTGLLLVSFLAVGQAKVATPAQPETAADVVTLRDGHVALGQVVEPSPRGVLTLVLRRDWADSKIPDWSRRWQAVEQPILKRAQVVRKDRLNVWRQERVNSVPAEDPILTWIDFELGRISKPQKNARSVLMVVHLNRSDIKGVKRRPAATARMLRQGWLSGFPNVEEMPTDALRDALDSRGFSAEGRGEVSLDSLLPIPNENDVQWLARRAATEVATEPKLRFLQTQGLVLQEPEPGQPATLEAAGSAIGQLTRLLTDTPSDPLAEQLQKVGALGRVGAVVTRLEISPDLNSVRVESVLLARTRTGQWNPVSNRASLIRPEALAPNAGQPLQEDPQVKAAFKVVESLGLGQIPDSVKQQSLNVGAATQKALGEARSALLEDIATLAFPVTDARKDDPKPAAKP